MDAFLRSPKPEALLTDPHAWDELDGLSQQIKQMEAQERNETVESRTIIEEGSAYKPKRVWVSRNARPEDILNALILELESMRRGTISHSQRLGVEAAIRLVKNGVYIQP